MNRLTLRQRMMQELFVSDIQLNRLIRRAPHTYKVYTIPKRTGGRRVIAQPARETKYLQRWLISNIFCDLPVHESATAYKLGASIKKNAEKHARNSYLTKFDFKDFFTSIKETDLKNHFANHLTNKLTEDEAEDAALLC